jgi:hypothetical protein
MAHDDPAFPEIKSEMDWDPNKSENYTSTYSEGGLTKREYFAAAALTGLLANPRPPLDISEAVVRAITAADRMLSRLEGK